MWDKTNETDLGRRVAALESQTVDLRRRVAEVASRVPVLSEVRYAPVDDHQDTERPAEPELVKCERWKDCRTPCSRAKGKSSSDHRYPHDRRPDCDTPCNYFMAHCVPAPTPVGTEAFRLEMASQAEFLSNAYGWVVRRMLGKPVPEADANVTHPERLAGVACAIRDAYDLARVGENEAAQEKLREIEW